MQQHIAKIALLVSDYDEAIAYYTTVMGFRLVADEDRGGGKRFVRVAPPGDGRTELVLAKAANQEQIARIGNQTGGRVFLFLNTDNFDRDHAAFIARGVTFSEPPRREIFGKVAVFTDRFGNRWELIEPFPG